jgi:uncharacterized protein
MLRRNPHHTQTLVLARHCTLLRHTATVKLHADADNTYLAVTAYGDDHIAVNGRKLHRSLLLMPDRIDEAWGPDDFISLAHTHLDQLAALSCDVLLLGTGHRQCFPPHALLRPLIEAGRGIEVMDTRAACRTYNILVAEGRIVAAALIIETTPFS